MATRRKRMYLADISGEAFINQVDNDPSQGVYVFLDPSTDGEAFFETEVPSDYVGTPRIELGLMANATTGEARLVVGHFAVADTESWDGTYTDETAQDVTTPATAYVLDHQRFPTSGSLTTTAPAVDDILKVRVQRDADHANDDLATEQIIVFCWFVYEDA